MFGRSHTAVKIPTDYVLLCTSSSAYATDRVRKLLNQAKITYKTKTVSNSSFLRAWLPGILNVQGHSPSIEFYVHRDDLERGREILKEMEKPPVR